MTDHGQALRMPQRARSEELEVLKIVTGRLEQAGIGYMVTGSMALNYYARCTVR